MIDQLREQVADAVGAAILTVTGLERDPASIPVEDPPRPEMGDLACPVALQLSRELGRNPRELGEALAAALNERPTVGVVEWTVAGPGFLNVRLGRSEVLLGLLRALDAPTPVDDRKILVEHTSINPNKAAHIGHLRNSCLGDTLARVFRYQGHPVEVHNYIDDTGVQVADVVIGFLDLRGLSPEQVSALPEPFDYTCWDLYTEVSQRLESDEGLQQRRRDVLAALESQQGIEAAMAEVVAARVVARHVRTMRRLGIEYDLLVHEGDILALDLWAEAFRRLADQGAAILVDDGKHAGCWVMPLSGAAGFEELEEADKVLVRSNGVATYVAKDIAYHLWKYGLLDRDFRYRPVIGVEPASGGTEPIWRTTRAGGEERPFGHADRAVTVIDVRQSYLQSIVEKAFYLLGEPEAGDSFTHFAYEMVALSPRTATELGIEGADDDDRAFVEMSGRRGYGVKADDLLDRLEARATDEVGRRNPDLTETERETLGREIAVGAARYFLLRYARNTVIVFDLDDALSFEGETGPYLQYAAVRADRIFDRLAAGGEVDAEAVLRSVADGTDRELMAAIGDRLQEDAGELWDLILALTRLEEVVDHGVRALEISAVAKYGFGLAQAFNRFYHGYPIIQADSEVDRALRILVAHAFRRRLRALLDLLGIPLPARM